MNLHLIQLAISLVAIGPFLAIPVLLLTFYLRRSFSRKKKHNRQILSGFTPSTFALGLSLQYLEKTFTQPGVEYVLQEKYEEEADQDESGDPDQPKALLLRQLRQIRNGKPIDRLLVLQQKPVLHE